jgi:hypothetical protein
MAASAWGAVHMTHSFLLRAALGGIATAILMVSLVLSPFALLPGMFIGLGWGLPSAAASLFVALLVLGVLTDFSLIIATVLTTVLPVLWFVRLALLSRPVEIEGKEDERVYYPPDRLITWAAGISAGLTMLAFLSASNLPGGLPQFLAGNFINNKPLIMELERLYQVTLSEDMIRGLTGFMLVVTPLTWMLLVLANLQLAQKLAVFFKVNIRPTPDYEQLTLPGNLELVLAGCLFVTLVVDGWWVALMICLVGLCLTAYFLLGLAVIHAISRPWSVRSLILVVLYIMILLTPLMAVPVSIIGLIESRFGLRRRVLGGQKGQ